MADAGPAALPHAVACPRRFDNDAGRCSGSPLLGSDPISDSQLRDSAGFAPVFPDHRV